MEHPHALTPDISLLNSRPSDNKLPISGTAGWLHNLLAPDELAGNLLADDAIRARLLILDGQFLLHYRACVHDNHSPYQMPFISEPPPVEHYKFLSTEAVRAAFSQMGADSDWLLPGVVRCGWHTGGQPWSVLYIPPGVHSLNLKLPPVSRSLALSEGQETATTGRRRRKRGNSAKSVQNSWQVQFERLGQAGQIVRLERVALPGLIFVGVGNDYRVWATAPAPTEPSLSDQPHPQKFDPQAPVLAAPLPNVFEDGRICWGSAREQLPSAQPTAAGIGTAWRLFLASEFTDHLINNKSQAYSADVRYQLLTNVFGDKSEYPIADLVPYRAKVGSSEQISVATAIQMFLKSKSA